MKILLSITFLLFFTFAATAQEEVSLPRDVAEKALKALELVPALEDKIVKLEKTVDELERAKQTPCTIAQEKVKNDLVFWTNQLSGDVLKDKEILKNLKDVRRLGRKSIASQCGFSSESAFVKWLDRASRFAPLLILLR